MSPRKVRLVAGLIRGMGALAALDQLNVTPKAAGKPVAKLLKSALANAEHNFRLKDADLNVKAIMVDKGPDLKRWRPRAFGRAAAILKHSCHITIVLGEKAGSADKAEKAEASKEKEKVNRNS